MTTVAITAIHTQEKFLAEVRKLSIKLFDLAFPGEPIGCTESQWREYKPAGWPCGESCRRSFCNGDWNAMLKRLGLTPATQSQAKRASLARRARDGASAAMQRDLERQRLMADLDAPVEEIERVREDWGLTVSGAPRVVDRGVVVRMRGEKVEICKRAEVRYMLR